MFFFNISDDWMKEKGFIDDKTRHEQETKKNQWEGATIKDLHLAKAITIPAAISITNAIEIMKANGFDQLPVTSASDSKHCIGLVTLGGLLAKLNSNRAKLSDQASTAMYHFKVGKKFKEITMDTPLETLTKFFETNSSAVVTRKSEIGELLIESVVTKVDLLSFLTKKLEFNVRFQD
jgi:cystathionine beta-synthase